MPSATFENHKDEEEVEEERVNEEVVEFNDGRIRHRAIFKSENDDIDSSNDDVSDDDVENAESESDSEEAEESRKSQSNARVRVTQFPRFGEVEERVGVASR